MEDRLLFGQVALQKGYLTLEQLQTCMYVKRQVFEDNPLGEIACCLGFLDLEQVGDLLWAQKAWRAELYDSQAEPASASGYHRSWVLWAAAAAAAGVAAGCGPVGLAPAGPVTSG